MNIYDDIHERAVVKTAGLMDQIRRFLGGGAATAADDVIGAVQASHPGSMLQADQRMLGYNPMLNSAELGKLNRRDFIRRALNEGNPSEMVEYDGMSLLQKLLLGGGAAAGAGAGAYGLSNMMGSEDEMPELAKTAGIQDYLNMPKIESLLARKKYELMDAVARGQNALGVPGAVNFPMQAGGNPLMGLPQEEVSNLVRNLLIGGGIAGAGAGAYGLSGRSPEEEI